MTDNDIDSSYPKKVSNILFLSIIYPTEPITFAILTFFLSNAPAIIPTKDL